MNARNLESFGRSETHVDHAAAMNPVWEGAIQEGNQKNKAPGNHPTAKAKGWH